MTGLIDRLKKKTHVIRPPKIRDRRFTIISLAREREELSRQLPDPLGLKLEPKLSDLDTGYMKQVSTIIDELLSMIEVNDASSALPPDWRLCNRVRTTIQQ